MNDNNSNNNTYRATRNLNTALESPEYRADDTLDVNIKDVDNNNYVRNEIIKSDKVYENKEQNLSNNEKSLEEEIIKKNIDDSSANNNTFISSDIVKGRSIDNYDSFADDDNGLVSLVTDSDERKSIYTPTSPERKKKEPFSVTSELKLLIVIIIILLVFIFFMPKVYSFFKEIELFFFNR